jgi:hypothetical protein
VVAFADHVYDPQADIVDVLVSGAGCVMVMLLVDEHPFASVTVNEYEPADRTNVPVPEYGPVPPVADTVTVEVPPLQIIGAAVTETVKGVGCETVILDDAEHVLASVTV